MSNFKDFAHILTAIGEGKEIEHLIGGSWITLSGGDTLVRIVTGVVKPARFRVKPLTINGHAVPEPMRVAPAEGAIYWMPIIAKPTEFASGKRWDGDIFDNARLQRGLCHSTREAAEAHAKALISFTEAGVE